MPHNEIRFGGPHDMYPKITTTGFYKYLWSANNGVVGFFINARTEELKAVLKRMYFHLDDVGHSLATIEDAYNPSEFGSKIMGKDDGTILRYTREAAENYAVAAFTFVYMLESLQRFTMTGEDKAATTVMILKGFTNYLDTVKTPEGRMLSVPQLMEQIFYKTPEK